MRMFVVIAALGAACSRSSEENLGLSGAGAGAADVAHLDRPAELLRALAMPGRELDRRLGARGVEASSSLKIEAPGRAPETLDETWQLDSDGRDQVHLTHDNARGYGVEATAARAAFYVRPRY